LDGNILVSTNFDSVHHADQRLLGRHLFTKETAPSYAIVIVSH